MKKYKTYDEFSNQNHDKFEVVIKAAAKLKAPGELGEDPTGGMAIAEATALSHLFMTVSNHCTDLLFGLSSSVLDAQANVNGVEGTLYGQKTGGATDRNRMVACDPLYLDAVKHYNDLVDLKKYLETKRDDCINNHHFYKQLVSGDRR